MDLTDRQAFVLDTLQEQKGKTEQYLSENVLFDWFGYLQQRGTGFHVEVKAIKDILRTLERAGLAVKSVASRPILWIRTSRGTEALDDFEEPLWKAN
jgi:hypothetical protein